MNQTPVPTNKDNIGNILTVDNIISPKSIEDEIENNKILKDIFAKAILENGYYHDIRTSDKGKVIMKKEVSLAGWTIIDRVLKITPHAIDSKSELIKREKRKEHIEYTVTVELRTLNGIVLSTATGKANSGEEYKSGFSESQLNGLAESRAVSRAHKLFFRDILEAINADGSDDCITSIEKSEDNDMINNCYDNAKKAISKPSFDHPGNPKLAQQIENKKQAHKQKKTETEEKQKNKSNKPKITGGITQDTPKQNKKKTAVEKAIEDKEKRDKEKEESFKTADKVESPPEDAEVLSHIKAIIVSLKEDEKEINETNIKLHLAERKKAKTITDEQCNEVLDKLAKMSIEELKSL